MQTIYRAFRKGKSTNANHISFTIVTIVFVQMCPFCRARFCLSHALPEVHGCGDDASRSARRKFKEAFQSSYGMSFAEANPSIGN